MLPKINEGQKLCYRILFNHVRQMAPTVVADAKSLVSASETARRAGSRWALPRTYVVMARSFIDERHQLFGAVRRLVRRLGVALARLQFDVVRNLKRSSPASLRRSRTADDADSHRSGAVGSTGVGRRNA